MIKIEFNSLDLTGSDHTDLPQDCVDDIAQSGPADEAVAYWRKRLDLSTASVEGTKSYLQATGAWDETELQDHETNLDRLLWLLAWDQAERNDD